MTDIEFRMANGTQWSRALRRLPQGAGDDKAGGSRLLLRAALLPFLLAAPVFGASLPERYARAYEDELTGTNLAGVVEEYREIAAAGDGQGAALAARALFRMGVCERRLGRPAAAREAFKRLAGQGSGDEALLARTRRELQSLDDELDRVTIRGRVLDGQGNPLEGACVLAGQWGVELPMLTAKDGSFTADRRLAERGGGGERYCLLYAEHPVLPLVLFDAVVLSEKNPAELEATLKPAIAIGGRVKDRNGKGIAAAAVIATAISPQHRDIPIPADRVLAPVTTGADGQFWIGGLDSSLRWRFAARREGYRMLEALEVRPDSNRPYAGEITLEAISAWSVAGVVHDPGGRPLQAGVTVWTLPPDVRQLGEAHTDEQGRYVVSNLPDEPVTVKAAVTPREETGPSGGTASWAERSLTGLRPSGGTVDFEIGGGPAALPSAELGKPAPELDVFPLRGGSLKLADCRGQFLLVYFWSRQAQVAPSPFIQRLAERSAARGVRVVCIHDQSGNAGDLLSVATRTGLACELALDRYAPAREPAALNSLTWARYGARGGSTALVDREGLLLAAGLADDPAFQARIEEAIGARTAGRGPTAQLFPSPTAAAGQAVPPLGVARWVRGDPATGGGPRPEDLRRRIVVYHFGSVYVAQSLKDQYPRELGALSQALKMYGPGGVMGIWVLPASENDETAGRLASALAPESLIAVDRNGDSYRAFGAGETSGNVVADERGVVAAVCTDQQLFRVVKDLTARERSRGGPP